MRSRLIALQVVAGGLQADVIRPMASGDRDKDSVGSKKVVKKLRLNVEDASRPHFLFAMIESSSLSDKGSGTSTRRIVPGELGLLRSWRKPESTRELQRFIVGTNLPGRKHNIPMLSIRSLSTRFYTHVSCVSTGERQLSRQQELC